MDLFDTCEEENEMKELYIYEDIKPEGVRGIMQALINSKFPQLTGVRIWKAGAKNEGARMVC